jgi:hypothetical protein
MLSIFGKSLFPSPGVIKTKFTGITRGITNVNNSNSFTNRGVCEKRSGMEFSIELDFQMYLDLDSALQEENFQYGKILGNVGIGPLSAMFQIQISA